jgi:hypothetical protein
MLRTCHGEHQQCDDAVRQRAHEPAGAPAHEPDEDGDPDQRRDEQAHDLGSAGQPGEDPGAPEIAAALSVDPVEARGHRQRRVRHEAEVDAGADHL